MGSSRSWAADHEDDILTCRHGVQHKYFDECRCAGCKADREDGEKVRRMSDSVKYAAIDYLGKLPEDQRQTRFNLVMSLLGKDTA